MQTKRKQLFTYALLILFVLLYTSIGTVSICHAINFFSVTNKYWSALMLAISFEVTNHYNDIDFFTKSILFFIKDTNPENNLIIISYITGAILPIVSLCITSMIVDISKIGKDNTLLKI